MTGIIIGMASDPTIQFFCKHSKKFPRNNPIIFIDQSYLGEYIHCSNTHLHYKNHRIKLENIHCVWNRLFITSNKNRPVRLEAQLFFQFLMDEVFTRVYNRPKDCMSNHAKLYQLQSLTLKHLKTPTSILTTQPYQHYPSKTEEWIFKSSNGVRSIVHSLSEKPNRKPPHTLTEPVLLQNMIPGENIRVHVLGLQCFATRCKHQQGVDYRYQPTTFRATSLPRPIAIECIAITQSLNLTFAGIDLILYRDSYTLLEVNAARGYHSFDDSLAITKALHVILGQHNMT